MYPDYIAKMKTFPRPRSVAGGGKRALSAGSKRLLASSLVLTLCLGSSAYAQNGTELRRSYSVTTWSGADGFTFGNAHAIVQDAAGYLWLGTSIGLVRFDGVEFRPWRIDGIPLDTFITALLVSSDGSLWVGLTTGIVRILNDRATLYTTRDGFRGELVERILEDREKTLWVSTATGVWRLRNGRWELLGPAQGLPIRAASALFLDREGLLWIGTAEGVFRRTPNSDTFQKITTSSSPVKAIVDDSHGLIWATDSQRTLSPVPNGSHTGRWPDASFGAASDVIRDRRGNVWVGTSGRGVLRLRPVAAGDGYERPEQITRNEGLAGNSVRALCEDREGNIWIGTAGGVTRLTERQVTSFAEGETVSALSTTADGSIWLGTRTGLIRFRDGRQQRYVEGSGLPSSNIVSLHSQGGTLWVATERGVVRLIDGGFRALPTPAGVVLQRVRSMSTDADGGVWISDLNDGLFRFLNGTLTRVEAIRELRTSAFYADKAGRLWVGQLNGDIAVYDIRQSTVMTAASSSRIGTITAIHADTRGNIWVGTTNGLSRLEGGHFVSEDIEEFASGVLSIAEVGRNQLWIATRAGLLRVIVENTANVPSSASRVKTLQVYDASDGLPALPVRAYPGVALTQDGSLLFATANGVARMVPELMPSAKANPQTPIRIETIVVDDRAQRIEEQANLPPGTSRIEFQYAALTMAAASKTRFLYKLDGYDPDWVHAGPRREAVYTNLPPGRYRFRVTTRDDGGPREEATWDFTIRSHFYQTPAFAAISGAIAFLLVTAAWRLRLWRLRNQFKMVLNERARIAREIHDTLLQGLYGVGLQIDVIGKQVQTSPDAKRRLDGVRELINKYVRETRSSIWLLRSSSVENRDFPAAIQEAAEALTSGTPVQLDFRVSGRSKRLSTERQEQLLRITHEAIMNAVTHARATIVHVELCFETESVRIRVSDNGCGFDPERPVSDEWGKWGLLGMRERAEHIGAVLNVRSVPGEGTTVESIVPVEAS